MTQDTSRNLSTFAAMVNAKLLQNHVELDRLAAYRQQQAIEAARDTKAVQAKAARVREAKALAAVVARYKVQS